MCASDDENEEENQKIDDEVKCYLDLTIYCILLNGFVFTLAKNTF